MAGRQGIDVLLGLTPLEVRIAPQRTQSGARGIHQNPVHLAGEPFHAVIPLVRNCRRMHIGQAAARQSRFDGVEPVCGGVKRVQTPGIAHACTQRQGLASCTSAKIHNHFAAMGVHQQSQEL